MSPRANLRVLPLPRVTSSLVPHFDVTPLHRCWTTTVKPGASLFCRRRNLRSHPCLNRQNDDSWLGPYPRDRASDSRPVLAAHAGEPAVPSQSSAPTLRLGGGLFGGKQPTSNMARSGAGWDLAEKLMSMREAAGEWDLGGSALRAVCQTSTAFPVSICLA